MNTLEPTRAELARLFSEFFPDNIPTFLKEQDRWALWEAKYNASRDKWDKIPKRIDNPAFGLSSAKPQLWGSFFAAVGSLRVHQAQMPTLIGLGFCMTNAPDTIGIDLDNCVDEKTYDIDDWAWDIVKALNSYTEYSPSGKGLRIFLRGTLDADWVNHDRGIEVYAGHQARFLTITGCPVEDTPSEVRVVDEVVLGELVALKQQYAKEPSNVIMGPVDMPEISEDWDLVCGDVGTLNVPNDVKTFLLSGELGEKSDRSGMLHLTSIALYNAGLTDGTVFSILATNPHVMEIALSHRRQDTDKALTYLWKEHCVKAKPKASPIAKREDFELVQVASDEKLPLPKFRHMDKLGNIPPTLLNIEMALRHPRVCGASLKFDTFRDEILVQLYDKDKANEPVIDKNKDWLPITDVDYTKIRLTMESFNFKPIARDNLRDVAEKVAQDFTYDSAICWADSLKWDGVPRIDTFYQDYFGAEDDEYSTAVSQYTWTALAGRLLKPGIKADMVPILVGEQGVGKSTGVKAMSPTPEAFAEINLMERDDDLSRKMRGVIVAEIGELRGLNGRDAESIKAFITRTHEHWIPKYKEHPITFPRRLVFIGTSNQDQFLADPTGNRRWLPLRVGKTDVEAIERDREQLWAEALLRFGQSGILHKDASRLAKDRYQEFTIRDSWVDIVEAWLDTPDAFNDNRTPRERDCIQSHEVLREALNIDVKNFNRANEIRVGFVLKELGFVRKRLRIDKKLQWVYVR